MRDMIICEQCGMWMFEEELGESNICPECGKVVYDAEDEDDDYEQEDED